MRVPFVFMIIVALGLGGPGPARSSDAPFESVTLERTPCFGPCPTYAVTVHADGRVEYTGKNHVQVKGTEVADVTAEEVEFLQAAVRRVPLREFADEYRRESDGCTEVWTDHPSIVISVEWADTTKTVRYYLGCFGVPERARIEWLANTIDDVARTHAWIGVRTRLGATEDGR